jgi:GMP synthase (glutamine-hydrolysing)
MRTALVITHVAFEDAGTLADAMVEAGFDITSIDACTADLTKVDALAPDLLVVMGGPIGAYEGNIYPFVDTEIALLRQRLAASRPTIGICLGSQMMAAALGARVYAGGNGKELGWTPIEAAADTAAVPGFDALLAPGLKVLHWHGDTFDLPAGAMHLARTAQYPNQAFAIGSHALALQFHPEVEVEALERWYVGHACELAGAKIDIPRLREAGLRYGPGLEKAAGDFWRQWLEQSETPS